MNLNTDTSLALLQSTQGHVDAVTSEAIDRKETRTGRISGRILSEKELQRLDEVSKDFEAVFVTEMMKPMFSELKPDPMFGGGKGEEIFQGFML